METETDMYLKRKDLKLNDIIVGSYGPWGRYYEFFLVTSFTKTCRPRVKKIAQKSIEKWCTPTQASDKIEIDVDNILEPESSCIFVDRDGYLTYQKHRMQRYNPDREYTVDTYW